MTTITIPTYQQTAAARTTSRARHFFDGATGKDLFQSKSPAIPVAASEATLNARRWGAYERQQKVELEQQNTDFIAGMFSTDSTFEAATNLLFTQDNRVQY